MANTDQTAPMRLRLERLASPIGVIMLVTDSGGMVRAIDFEDQAPRMYRLLKRHYGTPELEDSAAPRSITEAIGAYFEGDMAALLGLRVATAGTDFQRAVWTALRRIPAGTTLTYGALAKSLGRLSASRAVGLANGANPIAIVVPCHRVIGANGRLTGYGGGLERKRWLLDHEWRVTVRGT